MPRYLLDTSVVSVLLRDPFGPVATRVTRHGIDRMCTSIIVAAELRFGGAKAGSPRLLRQIEGMLGSISVLPFEPPADERYAELRTALERAGTAVGPNDMLIAAHALALGCTVVTAMLPSSRASGGSGSRIGCNDRRPNDCLPASAGIRGPKPRQHDLAQGRLF